MNFSLSADVKKRRQIGGPVMRERRRFRGVRFGGRDGWEVAEAELKFRAG